MPKLQDFEISESKGSEVCNSLRKKKISKLRYAYIQIMKSVYILKANYEESI